MSKSNNKRVTFTTSLNPDLIKELKIYCVMHETNMNEVIEGLIEELLKKEKEGGEVGYPDK
ncbi:MAG TPA: hypothetical protein PLF27_07495 [Sedimentibacter sp.]|nr:hypothetical protein [Defluviitaleaceae bacterium]HRC81214.1 hypothetical protein [Sedimentibacter sp.]